MAATLPVDSVSDTAYLLAFYRGLESARPDALFDDPYAALLAGQRGERLARRLAPTDPEADASGHAVRVWIVDELILQAIRDDAVDAVLNLGAGLDTRPYRLSLPKSLLWIDVDAPGVLAYKAERLADHCPACTLQYQPADVTDVHDRQALLQGAAQEAQRILVLTEGLLIYLSAAEIAALAADLRKPVVQCWVSDLLSLEGLRLMQAAQPASPDGARVKLLFAPENGAEFFRPHGWRTVAFRSCFEEGSRLPRFRSVQDQLADLTVRQRAVLRSLTAVVKLVSS